jgi:SAM-dependent methyltransferase
MAENSVFYSTSGAVPLASRLSLRARRRIFELFISKFPPAADRRVLDVGVTCDDTFPESNYFERWYPHKHMITCVGTENAAHLESKYPGVKFLAVKPGEPLPFRDKEFDVVFSNAVVEHAGGEAGQRAFISELCRVGRSFFITTPYRFFPVEHHTGLPLLHFLPRRWHRWCLRGRYRYWADEKNLRLLGKEDFRRLFPPGIEPQIQLTHLFGFPSNIVALGGCAGS